MGKGGTSAYDLQSIVEDYCVDANSAAVSKSFAPTKDIKIIRVQLVQL